MSTEAFDKVKSQIGYCGIWCGSCVIGNGTLRELTRRYEGVLGAYGLEQWGLEGFDLAGFAKGLDALRTMPLCSGCRMGGGREACELRACASSKGLDGCGECPDVAECEHAELLAKMRSGAVAAGLFVKSEGTETASLIDRWTTELRAAWPCCILFEPDRRVGRSEQE